MRTILLLIAALLPSAALASFNIKQIAPGVYVHHGEHKDINEGYGGDICNFGFVVGSKGVAVIDTSGSPKIATALRKEIRRVSKLPILYVINTHLHPDHVLGNAAFKADKPQFVGHRELAGWLSQRKDGYLKNQPLWVGADAAGTEVIPPTLVVQSTLKLDLGGRELLLTAHPSAHSHTDMSVFDTASQILWTGDLLFVERTPAFDGNVPSWLNVINDLKSVPSKQVVPGHGPVVTDGATAFDNEHRYLTALLTDVRNAIKEGLSLEETVKIAAQSEKGKWVLFDVVNRRNAAIIFPMLEWE